MRKKVLLITFLIPFVGFGQKFNRGLILPIADSLITAEKYCCILSPEKGFSVYDSPNGKIIGTLKRSGDSKKDDQVPYKIYLVSGTKKTKVSSYREIDYDIYAINYTDSVNGFIKIIDTTKTNWLSVDEIRQSGFRTVKWLDYMISKSQEGFGFYANELGLRLRKEPTANSEVIGSVRGDLFSIQLTGETSGQWNKVKVVKYKESPCETDLSEEANIEYKTEGWLKVIDDNGEPNLWRHTRGC